MTVVHRLTVDGKDYFLPSPVDSLKGQILDATKTCGGYVNVPGLRGGPGIDILFSHGMPVVWARIKVADAETSDPANAATDDVLERRVNEAGGI